MWIKFDGESFLIKPDIMIEGKPYSIRLDTKKYRGLANKLNTNKWVHVAGAYKDKRLTLYIDGKEIEKRKADEEEKV